jgi:hypothetical protein
LGNRVGFAHGCQGRDKLLSSLGGPGHVFVRPTARSTGNAGSISPRGESIASSRGGRVAPEVSFQETPLAGHAELSEEPTERDRCHGNAEDDDRVLRTGSLSQPRERVRTSSDLKPRWQR